MRKHIQSLIDQALAQMSESRIPHAGKSTVPTVERTRDPRHGDFASNVAMSLAKMAGRSARDLAADIIAEIPDSELVASVAIAGPGFINFTLSPTAYHKEISTIVGQAELYGRNDTGAGSKVQIEFVSANPTGPLHIGHGRHAAFGACVGNLLDAAGYAVDREYYVNDAGRQMHILTVSVWLRYLEQLGHTTPFPAAAYRGQYITEIARQLHETQGDKLACTADILEKDIPADEPSGDKDAHIDAIIERARDVLGEDSFQLVGNLALQNILSDIKEDLHEFRVDFDDWVSERSLLENKLIERTIKKLRAEDKVYEKDGALWFRSTDYGDEKDRVVVKDNGQTTYFATDIAHHAAKHDKGYDFLINVLGADHHGYMARIRAGYEAMGGHRDRLEIPLIQFVSLYSGGKKMQMSTRSGEFITLRELRNDVGNDAARFFFVMRSNDQHLDFDTELAKSHTSDNPVYYIQYAYARVCSVFKQLHVKGLKWNKERGTANLNLLVESHETELMRSLSRYPEIIELSAQNRAPHTVVHYLQSLANDFHTYYNAHTFIVDEENVRDARLLLIEATRHVIRNGLAILGVSAPESM